MRTRLPIWILAVLALTGASGLEGRDRDEGRELRQMVELLEIAPGSVVADVGAGGGAWTFRLAEHVGEDGHVFSTEVKTLQVEGLRAAVKRRGLGNVTVILGDEEHMGLPEDCCEALLLRLVYHAFDQPEKMRRSLAEAMKPGGRVLIIDFRPSPDPASAICRVSHLSRRSSNRSDVQDGLTTHLLVTQ